MFGEYHCLVLGGAYSVDKEYRLLNHYPWFPNELLTKEEMEQISKVVNGETYDFILSHTCPISWEPRDLFLTFIDQSKVDKSMEIFLEEIEEKVDWKYYLFGHYHDDRLVRPYVEMFYHRLDSLDNIANRWKNFKQTKKLPEGYKCDPKFYEIF